MSEPVPQENKHTDASFKQVTKQEHKYKWSRMTNTLRLSSSVIQRVIRHQQFVFRRHSQLERFVRRS